MPQRLFQNRPEVLQGIASRSRIAALNISSASCSLHHFIACAHNTLVMARIGTTSDADRVNRCSGFANMSGKSRFRFANLLSKSFGQPNNVEDAAAVNLH
jgi:hypothetical protein